MPTSGETENFCLCLPIVAQTLDTTCGAACFESMFLFFRGTAPGELTFAAELGTLALGYTPPAQIVRLAQAYGFRAELIEGAQVEDLRTLFSVEEILFVTWWDEDAGHYSLVQSLDGDEILLMDPWRARDQILHRLPLSEFIGYWNLRGSRIIRVSEKRVE